MLKTVNLTEKSYTNGSAMLLGGFDGLHLGHRLLVSRAKASGLPVGVMTIVNGKEGKSLFTSKERAEIFYRAGIDFIFELPFTEIKDLSPEDFLKILTEQFSPKLFVCGDDFRFGAKAAGTPEDLKRGTHVCVEVQPLLEMYGEKVSSSAIKKLLADGDVEKANALLNEEFFLIGEVVADRKVGRTLGFPTANVEYPTEKHPLKKGVYETRVTWQGKEYKGITNYGARPTFDNARVLTETYLDGFSGDLYGQKLTVRFVRFMREIQKFDNAELLKKQLTEDIRTVRGDD